MAESPTEVKSFTLDDATIARIAEWKEDPNNRASSLSEALRQMVDAASRRRRAVRRWSQTRTRGVQTSAQSLA